MGCKIELKGGSKKGREITDRISRREKTSWLLDLWVHIRGSSTFRNTQIGRTRRLMFERECFVLLCSITTLSQSKRDAN